MKIEELKNELSGIDIYLLDQILKGRFTPGNKICDAGFGGGRNAYWFARNGFEVHGIDQKQKALDLVKATLGPENLSSQNFQLGSLEQMPYPDDEFDAVLCSAVLHFAEDYEHFSQMFAELVRVMKAGGVLFIRMTSDIGIEDKLGESETGVYCLADGSDRFLLNRDLLKREMEKHSLKFVEQLKTVNVNDIRCMSTLVLSKT